MHLLKRLLTLSFLLVACRANAAEIQLPKPPVTMTDEFEYLDLTYPQLNTKVEQLNLADEGPTFVLDNDKKHLTFAVHKWPE